MTCPDHDVLVALDDGELAESRADAVRAHTTSCTRCQAELAELAAIARDLRAPVSGALGGKGTEAFADDVLAALDRPRAKERDARVPRWIGLLAAAALPFAIGVSYHYARSTPDVNEWSARGGADASEAITKHTLLQFGRVVGSSFTPLLEGAQLDPDALIAAEVGGTEGPPRYLLAFLVDAAGERHWIYPAYEPGAPPPAAIALPRSVAPRVLSSMVRLDHPAPGPGRLVAVVLEHSEGVHHVEQASLTDLGREALATSYPGALVFDVHVEVRP